MTQFANVTVMKQANIYFDGKVTSRTVHFADGSKKTLGIMLPGDYEFSTGAEEIMEFSAGELDVLLPNTNEWIQIQGSGQFTVPAHSSFKLSVRTVADYCCSYIDKR